jgi:hypothetical protein
MPGSFLAVGSGLPQFDRGKPVDRQVADLQDYVYQLVEELIYTLRNLSPAQNFNGAAAEKWEGAALAQFRSNLEPDFAALRGQISGVSGSVTSLTGTVGALSGIVTGLSGDVDALESGVDALTGSVAALSDSVGGLGGSVADLQTSVGDLDGGFDTRVEDVLRAHGLI